MKIILTKDELKSLLQKDIDVIELNFCIKTEETSNIETNIDIPAHVLSIDPKATIETWHQHKNGGGWVQNTAFVEKTVFIAKEALVCENAEVYGNAIVSGNANDRVYN